MDFVSHQSLDCAMYWFKFRTLIGASCFLISPLNKLRAIDFQFVFRYMADVIEVYHVKFFVGPILFSFSISLSIFAQIIVTIIVFVMIRKHFQLGLFAASLSGRICMCCRLLCIDVGLMLHGGKCQADSKFI